MEPLTITVARAIVVIIIVAIIITAVIATIAIVYGPYRY